VCLRGEQTPCFAISFSSQGQGQGQKSNVTEIEQLLGLAVFQFLFANKQTYRQKRRYRHYMLHMAGTLAIK